MRSTKNAWPPPLLAVILSLAGCASSGASVKPTVCPAPPQLPQRLLKKTDYAAQVRQELFEPASSPSPNATKPSTDTKP